jgi:hypothetical protein
VTCERCRPWILSATHNMGPFPPAADIEDTGERGGYNAFVLKCLHCGHTFDSVKPCDEHVLRGEGHQYVVIVTGAREWHDSCPMRMVLGRCLENCSRMGLDMILHVGDCKTGIDFYARTWAAAMGVTVHEYIADWGKHKLASGPIRNSEMVDAGGDICFAFWDLKEKNSGTFDCFKKTIRAGIKTEVYGPEWSGEAE